MPATADTPKRLPLPPVRLSKLLFVVVIAALGGGYFYLQSTRHTVDVYRAALDLPAYHQITQTDVRVIKVDSGKVPPKAVKDRNALIGHYTLSKTEQDRAFNSSQIGPRLTSGAFDKLALVAVNSTVETTLGGRLERGDRVNILMPVKEGKDSPARLRDILVVDVQAPAVKHASIVIAVTPADEEHLQDGLGAGRLVMVRVAPYSDA